MGWMAGPNRTDSQWPGPRWRQLPVERPRPECVCAGTESHGAPGRAPCSAPSQDSAARPDCATPSRSSGAPWAHVWPSPGEVLRACEGGFQFKDKQTLRCR